MPPDLRTTGVPTKFLVVYDELVSDCGLVESKMHARFANFREVGDREFFRMPVKLAVRPLREEAAPYLLPELAQLPARLRRGSRSAAGTPCTCRNASRGFASTNADCSGLAPCSRSITPPTSCAVSDSRRVKASTASWLPAGNRTN